MARPGETLNGDSALDAIVTAEAWVQEECEAAYVASAPLNLHPGLVAATKLREEALNNYNLVVLTESIASFPSDHPGFGRKVA